MWRWQTRSSVGSKAVVQFELLADLDDVPAERVVAFDGCKHLGAANVRGTRFASRNVCEMTLTADVGGVGRTVTINVTGVAGFLMAKVGAAKARAKPRDWYDIAFVLLHNDEQVDGADAVRAAFPDVDDFPRTALLDLHANFADDTCQGTVAYVTQVLLDHPDEDADTLAADAMLAVGKFCTALLG